MLWSIPINEGGAVNLIGQSGNMEIEIIATFERMGNAIHLGGVHFTRNRGGSLHLNMLRDFGRDFLRQHGDGATRLVVFPALRTTGATAGTGIVSRPITIELE